MTNVSPVDFAIKFYGQFDIKSWDQLTTIANVHANSVYNSQEVVLEKQSVGLQVRDKSNIVINEHLVPSIKSSKPIQLKVNDQFLSRIADFFTRLEVRKSHRLVHWGCLVVTAEDNLDHTFGKYGRHWPGSVAAVEMAYHSGNILAAAESYCREILPTQQRTQNPAYSPAKQYDWDRNLDEVAGQFFAKVEAMRSAGLVVPPSERVLSVMKSNFPEVPNPDENHKIVASMMDGISPR